MRLAFARYKSVFFKNIKFSQPMLAPKNENQYKCHKSSKKRDEGIAKAPGQLGHALEVHAIPARQEGEGEKNGGKDGQ